MDPSPAVFGREVLGMCFALSGVLPMRPLADQRSLREMPSFEMLLPLQKPSPHTTHQTINCILDRWEVSASDLLLQVLPFDPSSMSSILITITTQGDHTSSPPQIPPLPPSSRVGLQPPPTTRQITPTPPPDRTCSPSPGVLRGGLGQGAHEDLGVIWIHSTLPSLPSGWG